MVTENKKLRAEMETLKHSSETLEQENRRLKDELTQLMKQIEDEALKGMAKLRLRVENHLFKKITDDKGKSNIQLTKESPKEVQIKDVEHEERKTPEAKKETNKGEFLLLLLFLTQFLSNLAEEMDPTPDQEQEEDATDPDLLRLEGEKIYLLSEIV